jgi:SAM-dependent methyltransferase
MIDQEILKQLRCENQRRKGTGIDVLDVGCGRSPRTRQILEELDGGQLYLVDYNEAALAFQRQLLCDAGPRVRFIQADLTQDELARYLSGPIAVVLLTEVIEHLPDAGPILQQIAALLQPGGLLFVSVPVGWVDKFMMRLNPSYMRAADGHKGHVEFYSRGDLVHLLQTAGFKVETCKPAHARYFVHHLILNLFRVPIDADTGEVQPANRQGRLGVRLANGAARLLDVSGLGRVLDPILPRNYFAVARREG